MINSEQKRQYLSYGYCRLSHPKSYGVIQELINKYTKDMDWYINVNNKPNTNINVNNKPNINKITSIKLEKLKVHIEDIEFDANSLLLSFCTNNNENKSFVYIVDNNNDNEIYKIDNEIIINKGKNIKFCMNDDEWIDLLLYMDENLFSSNISSDNCNNNALTGSIQPLQANTNNSTKDTTQKATDARIPPLQAIQIIQ